MTSNRRYNNFLIQCVTHGETCTDSRGIRMSNRKQLHGTISKVLFRGATVFRFHAKSGIHSKYVIERYPEDHGFKVYAQKGQIKLIKSEPFDTVKDDDIVELLADTNDDEAGEAGEEENLCPNSKKIKKQERPKSKMVSLQKALRDRKNKNQFNFYFPTGNRKTREQTRIEERAEAEGLFPKRSKPIAAFKNLFDRMESMENNQNRMETKVEKIELNVDFVADLSMNTCLKLEDFKKNYPDCRSLVSNSAFKRPVAVKTEFNALFRNETAETKCFPASNTELTTNIHDGSGHTSTSTM